jgi:hypothetical protein
MVTSSHTLSPIDIIVSIVLEGVVTRRIAKQTKDRLGPPVKLAPFLDLCAERQLELEGALLMRSQAARRRMKRALEQVRTGRGVSLGALVEQLTAGRNFRSRQDAPYPKVTRRRQRSSR